MPPTEGEEELLLLELGLQAFCLGLKLFEHAGVVFRQLGQRQCIAGLVVEIEPAIYNHVQGAQLLHLALRRLLVVPEIRSGGRLL